MADEPAKIILGDTAIAAVEASPGSRRRFFRRRKKERLPLTHCENCGASLQGPWCAQCGQPAIDYRRSFRHVVIDVLDSFLNWDTKFVATIVWLIVRPWRLTNEFLAGHRVRYVNPLRLYLLASILFFLVVNFWAKGIHAGSTKMSAKDRAEIEADLAKEKDLSPEIKEQIRRAMDLSQSPSPAPSPAPSLSAAPSPSAVVPPGVSATAGASPPASPSATASPSPNESDNDFVQIGPNSRSASPFAKWLQARAREKFGEHGSNLQVFVRGLISNLPYMVLCCIPLFALVLKILYLFRRILYIDHLVYALHIHTFAYAGIMLISLATIGLNRIAPATLAAWLIALLWCTFTVQVLLSIRRVYRQNWFLTVFKFLVGGFIYLMVLVIALAATFFVTLALPT